MREHELKCWPSFFNAIARGEKTFEVRQNDRDFDVGDVLLLEEYEPHGAGFYTGERIRRQVTYILHGGRFGVEPGWCVMGLGAAEDTPDA